MFSGFLAVVFSIWIFHHLSFRHDHWLALAAPVTFLGLAALTVRPTEEWLYTAWQAKAQRYERSVYD